ncbi:hypothetical protein BV22DRAFT_434618 [Leucogyrophana mollusca]|uniref:Uncharacterized protein n=1 Tax=Leucogyrophana mollusca TaxID=85980 RepID=A0ACB8BI21_9AGAM|nr:hypothetical protein BV22DRAFT_434618 [Leucogyrophana mollusca]
MVSRLPYWPPAFDPRTRGRQDLCSPPCVEFFRHRLQSTLILVITHPQCLFEFVSRRSVPHTHGQASLLFSFGFVVITYQDLLAANRQKPSLLLIVVSPGAATKDSFIQSMGYSHIGEMKPSFFQCECITALRGVTYSDDRHGQPCEPPALRAKAGVCL